MNDMAVGIQLDGTADVVWPPGGDSRAMPIRGPRAATVVIPADRREHPLAGSDAGSAIEGRGWTWPQRAGRSKPRNEGPRAPVPILLQLLDKSDGNWSAGHDRPQVPVGDLLAHHLAELAPDGSESLVIAVPDTLSEIGQQRLLDGVRHRGRTAELLWRPIATVLAWAEDLSSEDISALDGTRVLHVHLGLTAAEASILKLNAEKCGETVLLVPERSGPGNSTAANTAKYIEPIEILEEAVESEAERAGAAGDMAWQVMWTSDRPWNRLFGEAPDTAIVRTQDGRWRKLEGRLLLPKDAEEDVISPIKRLIAEVEADSDDLPDQIIIEGPASKLDLGGHTLAEATADLTRHLLPHDQAAAVTILEPGSGTAARGSAIYARRHAAGLPTYYDVIPQLSINAIKDQRPRFIQLMHGQKRVSGGQTAGPFKVEGFNIGAGTEAVNYYLSREDQQTVKLTRTQLEYPPTESVPVDLVVEQRPGQGFATVEIRPRSGSGLGTRPVFLDWNTMSDTEKSEEEVLAELQEEHGISYPDPEPMPAHWELWLACDIPDLIQEFLAARQGPIKVYRESAKTLREAMGTKRYPGWLAARREGTNWADFDRSRQARKSGVISSDGELPSGSPSIELGVDLGEITELYSSLRQVVDADFKKLDAEGISGTTDGKALHRQLLLIGGWCYSAAPDAVMEQLRAYLRGETTRFKKYNFYAIGRSFHSSDDISLFSKHMEAYCKVGNFTRPFDRIKALVQILQYRKDGPHDLTHEQATLFAGLARAVMVDELSKRNIKDKFFTGAILLVGLLRYRIVEPGFLDQRNEHAKDFVNEVLSILNMAIDVSRRQANAHRLRRVLEQIEAYIEMRGTDALLFRELEELSGT